MTRPSGLRTLSSASWGITSASQALPVTSKIAWKRFEAVSSGPNIRKLSGLRAITSRTNFAATPVASLLEPPGLGTSTA